MPGIHGSQNNASHSTAGDCRYTFLGLCNSPRCLVSFNFSAQRALARKTAVLFELLHEPDADNTPTEWFLGAKPPPHICTIQLCQNRVPFFLPPLYLSPACPAKDNRATGERFAAAALHTHETETIRYRVLLRETCIAQAQDDFWMRPSATKRAVACAPGAGGDAKRTRILGFPPLGTAAAGRGGGRYAAILVALHVEPSPWESPKSFEDYPRLALWSRFFFLLGQP
ncbi:hypothetical protein TARUN_5686 [Trichoderma arundinaceum]|uniref:Uncharacterized protein n=1 Tax=Trichoderma arundinaceum TaxID=490622 RepID=A0A395NKD4_TRIAR|nr:hypothetical protein TARUN_5686 [Trichoderma arundinaceum]